jgi:hypothetical protein
VVNREKPFITLTIEQFSTEESYDVVYISDAFGLRYMLSGKQKAGRQLTTDTGAGKASASAVTRSVMRLQPALGCTCCCT